MARPLTPEQTVRLCLADAFRTGGVESPEYASAVRWLDDLVRPRVTVDEEHEVIVHLPRRPTPGPSAGTVLADLTERLDLGALAEWAGLLLVVIDVWEAPLRDGTGRTHVLRPWKRDTFSSFDGPDSEQRRVLEDEPHAFLDGTRRVYLDDELEVGALLEWRGELWRVEERLEYATRYPQVANAVRFAYRVVPA